MFDDILIVDWSGGKDRGPTPKRDAIWMGDGVAPPLYCRNRQVALAALTHRIDTALTQGIRLLIGVDFGLAYPKGFARHITGQTSPFAMWDWLAERVDDTPQDNNRFDIAAEMNRSLPGIGPFWGNGLKRDIPDLPRKGRDRSYHWATSRRDTERLCPGSFECWQLAGAGSVGSQIIMGLPVLAALRARFGKRLTVWPFEAPGDGVTLVEVWPSLIAKSIANLKRTDDILDAAQVSILAATLARADIKVLLSAPEIAKEEGWILGAGQTSYLVKLAKTAPLHWQGPT